MHGVRGLETADGLIAEMQLLRVAVDHLLHRGSQPLILNLEAVDLVARISQRFLQVLNDGFISRVGGSLITAQWRNDLSTLDQFLTELSDYGRILNALLLDELGDALRNVNDVDAISHLNLQIGEGKPRLLCHGCNHLVRVED